LRKKNNLGKKKFPFKAGDKVVVSIKDNSLVVEKEK